MADDRRKMPGAKATIDGDHDPATTAAHQVQTAQHLTITLPLLGTVRLPPPQQLAYYGAVGALLALEVIDWPLALLVTAGHALTTQQHNQSLQEFGEALDDTLR